MIYVLVAPEPIFFYTILFFFFCLLTSKFPPWRQHSKTQYASRIRKGLARARFSLSKYGRSKIPSGKGEKKKSGSKDDDELRESSVLPLPLWPYSVWSWRDVCSGGDPIAGTHVA